MTHLFPSTDTLLEARDSSFFDRPTHFPFKNTHLHPRHVYKATMADIKPPFTEETAEKKVKAAQDMWNTQ